MRVPRGPVNGTGEVSREWRRRLQAQARLMGVARFPRGPLDAIPSREWRDWLQALSTDRLPRPPLLDGDGPSDAFRAWLEDL